MHQNNALDVSQGYAGTPWATMRNPPFEAHCKPGQTQCTAKEWSALAYLNYKLSPMDNIFWRVEPDRDSGHEMVEHRARPEMSPQDVSHDTTATGLSLP